MCQAHENMKTFSANLFQFLRHELFLLCSQRGLVGLVLVIMLYIQGLRTSGAEAPSSSVVGLKGRCEGCALHTKGMKPQGDRMNGVKMFALYLRNVPFPV